MPPSRRGSRRRRGDEPLGNAVGYVLDESLNEIYIFDADTLRFIHVNRGARENLGYTLEELRRLTPLDLKPEYSPESFAALIAPLRRGEQQRVVFETVHRRKDGSRYPVEVHLELREYHGRPAFVAIILDLTERRQAEARARAAQQKFWRLVEFAPDATVLVDADGRLAYVNFQAERLFGYPRAQLLGQPVEALMADDRRAIHAEHRRRYVKEPSYRPMGTGLELRARRADGTTFPVDVSLAPLQTPDGPFFAASIRDVSRQQRMADELRRSEQRYRSLVRGALYGVYRSTIEGKLLEVNPALVEMLGYDSETEVVGLDLQRDVYADPGERRRLIEQLGGAGSFRNVETRWRRKDNSIITVRLSGRSVRDEQGVTREFEAIVEDVTERRRFDEQVRQRQRLEAVGRLAGGVAHDFNNLLTVIMGSADFLLERLPEGDARRSEAVDIRDAAARAATLTRQLLAFSRQQVWQPRVLGLDDLVGGVERMARRIIGEDVALVTDRASDLGRVRADPGQLEQALMNLIVNARDAMPEGGTLTIATRNAAVPDDTGGRYPRMPPGRYVTIAVTDTGHGMDEETRNHAFEPFYTTKEVGRGTGLGLATVYGIVKQSDGYVWIDSEPGRGTTVTIYLPRVDEAAEPRGAPANTHHGLRGVETILLVEDDDAVRSVARRVLERHGYTVLEARSGREGIEVARQHHGAIHLLVTDLVMPEMSGRRSAEHLAVMQPEMKVLYMSGYPQRGAGREWVLEPDVAFLQKPFTVQSLAEKVRDVLDSG